MAKLEHILIPVGDQVSLDELLNQLLDGFDLQDLPEDENDKKFAHNHKDYWFRALTKYERRVDFKAIQGVFDEDALTVDGQIRAELRKTRDSLLKKIEEADNGARLTPEFISGLKLDTNQEVARALSDYLVGVWRSGRDLAFNELPGMIKVKVEPVKQFEKMYAFCPTGEGGGIDNSCGPGGGSSGGSDSLPHAIVQKVSEWREHLWNKATVSNLAKRTAAGGDLEYLHPGEIIVYRGGSKHTQGGASWTKSLEIAKNRYGENAKIQTLQLTKDIPALDINKLLKDIPSKSESDQEVFVFLPSKKTLSLDYQTGLEPIDALNYFRTRALILAGIIDDDLLKQAKFELLEHIKGGRSLIETIGNLRSVFEPWVGDPTKIGPSGQVGIGFPPGTMAPENILMAYRLETIVRTETTTAMAQGRVAIGDAAGDYLQGYSLSAILDQRTSEVCRAADGIMFRKEDPNAVKLLPALHYQCRTIPVFVTSDDVPVEWSSQAEIDKVVRLISPDFK